MRQGDGLHGGGEVGGGNDVITDGVGEVSVPESRGLCERFVKRKVRWGWMPQGCECLRR